MAEYCQSNVMDGSGTIPLVGYLHANCHFKSKVSPHFIGRLAFVIFKRVRFASFFQSIQIDAKKRSLATVNEMGISGMVIVFIYVKFEWSAKFILIKRTSNYFKFVQHATHSLTQYGYYSDRSSYFIPSKILFVIIVFAHKF